MTAEASRCEAVQARLSDALLAGTVAAETDRQHAAGCADCGAFERDTARLARAFAADALPNASDALVNATLERAKAELAAPDPERAAIPEGYRREFGRLLGAALLPLPIVLAWNATVLSIGGDLLGGLLPAGLLQAAGTAYVLAGATWLGCLYGSLPLVAHRTMHRRALEMAS